VLRFTQVEHWNDLPEALKVPTRLQYGSCRARIKTDQSDGFQALADVREGRMSMKAFRNHLKSLIVSHKVEVDEAKVVRPF